MSDWAKLLEAVASLLWPAFAFTIVIMFRQELGNLLRRIKSGKLFGQEIELDQSLKALSVRAESAAAETPSFVSNLPSARIAKDVAASDDAVRKVLDEVPKSPKGALLILGAELERALRELLWSSGWHQGVGKATITRSIEHLEKLGVVPPNLGGSVRLFLEIRNRLLHGYGVTDDEVFRAIDIGLTILKTVLATPSEENRIYHPGVEVYSDPEGRNKREGILAVVLQTKSPGGASTQLRVYPTTRTHFKKGSRVSWEWNSAMIIEKSWYKHPDTGAIESGWGQSMEFVGRNIEDV